MDRNKLKRILALFGVVLLLAVFCIPMFFAGGTGEGSQQRFMAAAAVAIFTPILVYICIMAVRIFGHKNRGAGEIRNIVFDVGNVLTGFDWEEYLDSYSFPKEKRERIADAVFRSSIWNERDRGLYPEEHYVQAFVDALPEYEEDIRELMRRSPECVHPYPYSVTWLQYLQNAGYRTLILSNYSQYMLDRNRDQMAFLKYADGAVFSCEEKMVKPEPEIYERLLTRFHLNPAETVFIDDRAENVDAAVQRGMKGIVFRNFNDAVSRLEGLGVK